MSLLLIAVALLLSSCGSAATEERPATAAGPAPRVFQPVAEQELATYMTQLQVHTHKLSLAIDAGNTELARFYLHETEAMLLDIQQSVPEYEGIPVALYIDRIALPALTPLRSALDDGPETTAGALDEAVDGLIGSCNLCHESSDHAFIRIRRNRTNPYLQEFDPAP